MIFSIGKFLLTAALLFSLISGCRSAHSTHSEPKDFITSYKSGDDVCRVVFYQDFRPEGEVYEIKMSPCGLNNEISTTCLDNKDYSLFVSDYFQQILEEARKDSPTFAAIKRDIEANQSARDVIEAIREFKNKVVSDVRNAGEQAKFDDEIGRLIEQSFLAYDGLAQQYNALPVESQEVVTTLQYIINKRPTNSGFESLSIREAIEAKAFDQSLNKKLNRLDPEGGNSDLDRSLRQLAITPFVALGFDQQTCQ